MALIYGKTAQGLAEIETRAHRLTPRMRSALIMADGKRDIDTLKALVGQQAEDNLRELADRGFIAPVGEIAPPAAPAATPGPAVGADFDGNRRAAVRALTDLIGPAAEMMAIKMEKAKSPSDLRPMLLQAIQVIAAMRGRAAAEEYAQRFGAS